jgi:hypothetical protein
VGAKVRAAGKVPPARRVPSAGPLGETPRNMMKG